MPGDPLDDLRASARDALYVGVGLGVLGFQRLQVQRRELERALGVGVPPGRAELARLVGRLTGDDAPR